MTINVPPVRVTTCVPFLGTQGGKGNWQSKGADYGDQITTLHPKTKSDLIEQLNWLQRVIAGTENDEMGGGTIIVLRRRARDEGET